MEFTKFDYAHIRAAYVYAGLSYCKRKQVGCLVVKDGAIISFGYNGTPPGWDNCCEDDHGNTKPEVRHAEINAISKIAQSHSSAKGATVYLTCAPCIDCSVLLAASGIKAVYYAEHYVSARNENKAAEGIDHLKKCGVDVYQIPIYD